MKKLLLLFASALVSLVSYAAPVVIADFSDAAWTASGVDLTTGSTTVGDATWYGRGSAAIASKTVTFSDDAEWNANLKTGGNSTIATGSTLAGVITFTPSAAGTVKVYAVGGGDSSRKLIISQTISSTNRDESYALGSCDGANKAAGIAEATVEANKLVYVWVTNSMLIYGITFEAASEDAPTLESIAITGNMTKTAFYSDENADYAGLGVEGTYSNDSTATIATGIQWSIAPALAVGTTDYVVTATVGELTANKDVTLSVSVRPLPDPADAELTEDGYLLLNYEHAATVPNGIFLKGVSVSNIKIKKNTTSVSCIALGSSYNKNSVLQDYYIKLAIQGGFKTGDVVTIAGFFNNADSTKISTAEIFTLDADNNISLLYATEQFVNGRLVNDDPNVFTYTLEADADVLYIGRNGNTGTNIYTLKVVRPVAEEPVYDFAAVISGGSLETPLNIELTEGGVGLVGSYSGYFRVGTYSIVFADNSSSAPARAAEDAQTFTLDDNGMYDLAISYDGSSFTVTPTFNGYATAIENTEAQKVEKKMINGQLVIIKNGVEYSVLGARL